VARYCPKDQVRALVEGTLDLEDSLSQDVLTHVETCSSCRKLRAKLESKERSFRAALGAFVTEDTARCPSPADIATVSERGLDSADEKLVDHIARCAVCRMTLSAVSTAGAAAAKTPEETIAAARRRVALARAEGSDRDPARDPGRSDVPARAPSGRAASRVPSGRRAARTTRQVALIDDGSSRTSLIAAAVACVIVGFVYVAFVREGSAPPSDEAATTQTTPAAPRIEPSVPRAPRALEHAPAPTAPAQPQQPEEQVVAQATPAPSPLPPPFEPRVEEEPREAPVARPQSPDQPSSPVGAQPQASQPRSTSTEPKAPSAPSSGEPGPARTPVTPVTPAAPRADHGELACAAVTGPVEVRKKAEKAWRRLAVSDVVHDGEGLRANHDDASVTFASKARVAFDGDAVGTFETTASGVRIVLESGGMEGETLAYDGLEIVEANGVVTGWKGSRLRVEVSDKGLRVCVDKGSVNAGNDLGKVTVHAGQEITIVKDRKPERPTSLRGPYRSTPLHGR
jgi:hypothetical protein